MIDLSSYKVELGGMINGFFKRNVFIPYDSNLEKAVNSFIKRCKYTDVFQCIYQYSKDDIQDALLYGPMYLDMDGDTTCNIDTDKGFKAIKPMVQKAVLFFKNLGFTNKDINLYFSGSKGFHLTIDPGVLGIVPNKDLNNIYKAWALHVANMYGINVIDLRIYDKRRLFRLPNTINGKTGLYKVLLDPYDLYSMSLKELKEYASEPHEIKDRNYSISRVGAINFYKKNLIYWRRQNEIIRPEAPNKPIEFKDREILPCIKNIIENGSIKGSRNNTLIVLASGLFQTGMTLEQVDDVTEEWNKLNDPPLQERERITTIRSAFAMHKNGRRYGCSTLKEMGLCSDENCRIGAIKNGRQ